MSLPAVIEQLRGALQRPLPGHDGFLELSGYKRMDIERARQQDPPPRESAVLAMLFPKQGELHCLLMLRPEYDGVHSGQVAFPGGKREGSDTSLMHTALREFAEETGADTTGVDVLGALSPVYIPPSRMLVDPARETQPIIDQIRSGLISPQEAIRERGYDPDQVLAEWQEFAKKIDELGLILDIDPRVEARRKAVAGNLQEASTP